MPLPLGPLPPFGRFGGGAFICLGGNFDHFLPRSLSAAALFNGIIVRLVNGLGNCLDVARRLELRLNFFVEKLAVIPDRKSPLRLLQMADLRQQQRPGTPVWVSFALWLRNDYGVHIDVLSPLLFDRERGAVIAHVIEDEQVVRHIAAAFFRFDEDARIGLAVR